MTDPYAAPPEIRRRMLRELAGLVLLFGGLVVLLLLLWDLDARLGIAALALAACALGWRLASGPGATDDEGT